MDTNRAKLKKSIIKTLFAVWLIAILSITASAAVDPWITIRDKILDIVCQLKTVFKTAATGVGALILTMAAVQWIASETDAGARKKAKTSMIHVMVGLIIVSIADEIAGLVLTFTCP
ncbi:MAG: hypothetical protein PHG85_04950 [Candidatus Altiarchaeota archaeon]|nr:hypothetical protein [Candidatus Altiarchaeota archaeon]